MGKPAQTPSRVGEVLGGKYRLEQRLAVGGMGEVYRAINLAVERPVAIKLLRRDLTHNQHVVKRFLREGKTANRVNHPNIARVLDILRDGEQVFIVQDLLEGEDLQQVLKREGKRLPPSEVIDIVIPVADALGQAHAAGLVHRDLKPANIFLRRVGSRRVPMVLDFGIAKVISPDPEGDTPLTQTGTSMGTPAYMSPEQVMSPRNVDARSDVWALGVLIHRAVSGRLPFKSDSPGGLMVTICTKPPQPLLEAAPHAPEELADVVACCLSRQPEDRFASGTAVARALEGVREALNEQISGFVVKDTPESIDAPRNYPLPDLELELPPPSGRSRHNSTPAPKSATRPKAIELDDSFSEAPTVLKTPVSQRPFSSQPPSSQSPTSSPPPNSQPPNSQPPNSQPPISQPHISRPPASSEPPMSQRSGQASIRPAVSSMRAAVTGPRGSVPPRSSRSGTASRNASASPAAPDEGLHLAPLALATVASLPVMGLGWAFRSQEGIASLIQRVGAHAVVGLTVAAAAAGFRTLMLVRQEDGRVMLPACIGFVGTAAMAALATLAALEGKMPATWINLPGAISAAIATGGIGLVGLLRARTYLSDEPKNATAGYLYGAMAVIAVGAAMRLIL